LGGRRRATSGSDVEDGSLGNEDGIRKRGHLSNLNRNHQLINFKACIVPLISMLLFISCGFLSKEQGAVIKQA